jgi:hypothetical protein
LKSYTDRVLKVYSKRWDELCQSAEAEKDWKEIEQYAESAIPGELPSGAKITPQGFPNWTHAPDGGLGIDLNGALAHNPFIQETILYWQLLNDPPPIPQRIPGHPRGKKDTDPFAAWAARYPKLNQDEIAALTGYSTRQIRRWLRWAGT